ncbi:aminotransferase class I/II-fold pyridoxal phosphate-dependent enzyme [Streptomyces sp. RY43-2]|uniref:histidinol-phosphate transaminase n=1 Tax=Streptomyces macrolidinus TaxID=2952607 RepID=A0ABT0ZDL0_9ACTN|nr:aminotransferase class I/II-fold pyridoxal phosphate-dependent enzyme [Streptomyces macrolidinus]MCN9241641.1 aminotransferase class I/II-fold pyridoxal phosphate-dependent enzyme [Streptomyces macrolidinus]
MRRPADIDALRQALCAALGSVEPVCSLSQLALGEGVFTDDDILHRPTLVTGAAGYGPTSPAPTAHDVDALVRRAEEAGAAQILVPGVRRTDDTGALRAAGFVPVAAGAECVVRLNGDVDELLRGRLGAERLDDLRRRGRVVSDDLTWERIPLSGLDKSPWARDAFADLHGGLFDAAALQALEHSRLADRAELLVRRRGENVVQAGLLVGSHSGRGLYCLALATDRDDPAARHDLHAVSLYQVYVDAHRDGLDWVHLGRGEADHQRALGADLFVPLDHWLRAPGLTAPEQAPTAPEVSRFTAPPVTTVAVPGPARFRHRPRFDLVDLSSNTNPFLGRGGRYPELDTTDLARTYLTAVAQLPGQGGLDALTDEYLLFSSGAVDAVMLLLTALASPGDRVCVTPPTFELYGHFARVLSLPVVEVPLGGQDMNRLDVTRMLAADPHVTILCDPNNPVGTRPDPEQVHELIAHTEGLVVIDEAYVEFSDKPSYAGLVAEHDNLIVLRTLSKAWGLAGARCGIALAQPGIIEAMRRVQVPFGFTDASQRAVRERLVDVRHVRDSIGDILAERDRMAALLAEHPTVDRVFPSDANFLLVRLHKHEQVMDRLRAAGVLVADVGRLIPDTCRISIGDRRANETLLDALTAAL